MDKIKGWELKFPTFLYILKFMQSRASRWTNGGTAFPRGTKLLFLSKTRTRIHCAVSAPRIHCTVSALHCLRKTGKPGAFSFRSAQSRASRWTNGGTAFPRGTKLLFLSKTRTRIHCAVSAPRPVEPKPPSERMLSERTSTVVKSACGQGKKTSCATRSPCSITAATPLPL